MDDRQVTIAKEINRLEADLRSLKSAQLMGFDVTSIKETAMSFDPYDFTVTTYLGPGFEFTARSQDYPQGTFVFDVWNNSALTTRPADGSFDIQIADETGIAIGSYFPSIKTNSIGTNINNNGGGTLYFKVYFVGTDLGSIRRTR